MTSIIVPEPGNLIYDGIFDRFKRRGTGKFVLFDIGCPPSPSELTLQVVTPEGVKTAIVTDPNQIAAALSQIKRAANGMFVGIFQAGYGAMIGDVCHRIPACVVPQKPTKDAGGGHDLNWALPGGAMAYRLTIPLLKLSRIQLLLDKSDIPADRGMDPNYDPMEASKVC